MGDFGRASRFNEENRPMILDFILYLALTMGLVTFGLLLVLVHFLVKDILIPFWKLYILREKS